MLYLVEQSLLGSPRTALFMRKEIQSNEAAIVVFLEGIYSRLIVTARRTKY